jgi:3-methyladenine DNA glycosylase/8-oxoguanine DNA glycosylase
MCLSQWAVKKFDHGETGAKKSAVYILHKDEGPWSSYLSFTLWWTNIANWKITMFKYV